MKKVSPRYFAGFIAASIYVALSGLVLWVAFGKSGYWGLSSYLAFYGIYGPTVVGVFWLFSRPRLSPLDAAQGAGTTETTIPRAAESTAESTFKPRRDRTRLACTAFLITTIGMTLAGFVGAYGFDVHPMDRGGIVFAFELVGITAASVVVVAIFLSAAFE